MTQFFLDTFTESATTLITSHTSDSGHTWVHFGGSTPDPNVYTTFGGVVASGVNSVQAIRCSSLDPADAVKTTATAYVGTTSGNSFGVMARANSAGDAAYLGAYLPGTSKWYIFRVGASMATTQLAVTSGTYNYSIGDTPTIELLVSGTGSSVSLELIVSGTSLLTVSDTNAARITAAGYPGLWFSSIIAAQGWFFGSMSADTVSSDSIAISTPVDGKIIQRSGTTGTISVTGTYTGTPTTIEARLVNDGTSTAVSGFDWATAVASPSGGTFSFSFSSVPKGGWYNVQVRFTNNTATNATGGKVGVGDLFVVDGQSSAWLWFSTTAYAGDSSLTPDTKLRIAGKQPTAWDVPATATMNAAIACGNALIATLGHPVGLLDGSWNGSGLTISSNGGQWINGGAAGNAYTSSAAAVSAETTSVAGCIWIQGESDAGSGVTQSAYYTALGQMIALRRSDVGNTSLPYVVALLARNTIASFTDVQAQAIKSAQVQKAGDANIYRVDRYDLPLYDGLHHTAAGYAALGLRCARALLFAMGEVSTYRGPRISAAYKVDSTTFDVVLAHDMGSDYTPSTGITGFRVLDGGTPVTISTVVWQSATRVRITLSSAPSALPVIQYAYGATPTITGVLLDNSSLTLPLEFNAGETAVEKSASVTLVDSGGSPQASLTGLKWVWFDQVTPDLFVAPTDQGTGEVTNGSGILTVNIPNSSKQSGQVGWMIVTDSDGTTTQTPAHKAFSGPVAVN